MEKPRIRHIAINVQDREKEAEYYKKVFGLEEKSRMPNGTIYLSDGFVDVALISTPRHSWGIHHFGFQVESVKAIEETAQTTESISRRMAGLSDPQRKETVSIFELKLARRFL